MKIAELKYNYNRVTPSDINEHLAVLKRYTEECDHVTELGVRGIVSTWAFLVGKPKRLVSIDINHPGDIEPVGSANWHDLEEVYVAAKQLGVDFEFIKGDDLKIDLEDTDLMFIDTLHTYEQLSKELKQLSCKAGKYIILHDTVTFGSKGETGGRGLLQAVSEFLKSNKDWKIVEQFFNNNGLTILGKKTK